MLKSIFGLFVLIFLPLLVSAKTITADLAHNGHEDRVVITERNKIGSVEIYENEKLLGKYDNLIVDEASLSSSLVPLAGGGLAIEIDSEGSRNKFHIVAPIKKIGGLLYVDCIYKSTYDSVDETRSVGVSCKKTELSKFDAPGAINGDGMIVYSAKPEWLKNVPPATCINAVGLENGAFRIVRCSNSGVSDTKNQKIIIFDKQGQLLVVLNGYELIPQPDELGFALTAGLEGQTIIFNGNFECLSKKNIESTALSGTARIAKKLTINYKLGVVDGCMAGHYFYSGGSGNIGLKGYENEKSFYLLEIGSRRVSSGLFILDRLGADAHGVWAAVPPREPLTVN